MSEDSSIPEDMSFSYSTHHPEIFHNRASVRPGFTAPIHDIPHEGPDDYDKISGPYAEAWSLIGRADHLRRLARYWISDPSYNDIRWKLLEFYGKMSDDDSREARRIKQLIYFLLNN